MAQPQENEQNTSWLEEPIRVIMVRLLQESRKTWRVLNNGNPDLYPVKLGLSRPLNQYELLELADFEIEQDDKNSMFVVVRDKTLEHIRDNIDEYHATFDSAAAKARVTRAQAEAEDEHIANLCKELTWQLRRAHGLDAPPEKGA
ncbi:hypothetical protein C6A86_017025 [Mycobacterium sp. ITM-2016-00316]|uniref:hypothetical protein n=1 Tax=Mycobacterium sp. ITM-2016-00316 TaxID=2099695 RepID=UPI000CF9591A|nr:hypothetical protein [Mycobacterium sp. ITM-2016-00316]WNG79969.1 hypothetical protein C6A86_017025 [Mycobacterium sp. ITM-2016-00316]